MSYRLDSVAMKITDGSHNPPKGVADSEFLMLSSKNVFDDQLHYDAPRYLTPEQFQLEDKRTRVAHGDVLLTIVGTIGRCAVVPENAPKITLQRSVAVIRPNKELVDPRFLMYLFLSSGEELNAKARGVAQKGIYLESLRELKVLLPNLSEQLRIVAILDEAFAEIATAKANAEKNLQNARALFESYLNKVFTERGEGWVDCQLAILCSEITVGHVGSMKSEYKESGVPFLRSQNIRPFEVSMENSMFIDETFHKTLKKSRLQPGDLAIVRTGYPGTAAVIPDDLPDANCSDLVIVRAGPAVSPYFLAAFFNSSFGKQLVLGKLVGAAQKHFNVTAAKEAVLHVPPLDRQKEIAKRLDLFRSNTQTLEHIYQKKQAALDELKKSLLHQAFSGAL